MRTNLRATVSPLFPAQVAQAAEPVAERTISITEVAELLGVSRPTVYEAIRRNQLPAVRVGKRIVIPRARFMRWFEGSE